MACFLAVSLPISVSRKLYLFYRKIDIELKIIEVCNVACPSCPIS